MLQAVHCFHKFALGFDLQHVLSIKFQKKTCFGYKICYFVFNCLTSFFFLCLISSSFYRFFLTSSQFTSLIFSFSPISCLVHLKSPPLIDLPPSFYRTSPTVYPSSHFNQLPPAMGVNLRGINKKREGWDDEGGAWGGGGRVCGLG